MDETRQTLNELLVDLFNYILLIEERNLQESNVSLSMTEVHILEAIQKCESKMMSAIARRLMVTQGTLTVSTNKLVKKGYVERIRDEEDRRIVRLALTDKAQHVLDVHDQFHSRMIDKVLRNLNVGEDEALMKSLDNVLTFFKEHY